MHNYTHGCNSPLVSAGVLPYRPSAEILDSTGPQIPVEVVVGSEFAQTTQATTKNTADVAAEDIILDIGPKTAQHYSELIGKAGTIVWNGPPGVFEWAQFGYWYARDRHRHRSL
jgi:3-phosphoglycerate kinase